jgi:hypothetical protein
MAIPYFSGTTRFSKYTKNGYKSSFKSFFFTTVRLKIFILYEEFKEFSFAILLQYFNRYAVIGLRFAVGDKVF